MCGRYTLIASAEAIRALFAVPAFDERLVPPRYNIAPTQPVVVVRLGHRGRELVPMRWGLVPHWQKDLKANAPLILARADSVATKPAFRGAFRHRRCLIPASGFYEWQVRGTGPRRPHLIRPAPRTPDLFAFAGLWETWMGSDGSEIDAAAIITTDANTTLAVVHERMPVVLASEDYARWLDPATPMEEAQALLRPAPETRLVATRVTTRVNSVANDDPRLWTDPPDAPAAPVKAAEERQGSLF